MIRKEKGKGSPAILIYAVSFLSGVAALTYEISWSRQFGILFGHTVYAAAVVVASYFAGMAIGYVVAAQLGSRVAPMLGYAVVEFAIAVWAFVVPPLLDMLGTGAAAPLFNPSGTEVRMASRAMASMLVMLPATVAMGATLPLIAEELSAGFRLNARKATLAYALNTGGAVAGTIVTSGYLLVQLGVRASSYAATVLSVVCGLVGYSLYVRKLGSPSSIAWSRPSRLPVEGACRERRAVLWIAIVALSGFATLGIQVLYVRMFALVFHNSTYTFGAVVAVFLAGLAIGAAAVSWLQSRVPLVRLAALGSLAGSVGVLGSVLAFLRITRLEYFAFGEGFVEYMLGVLGLVGLLVLPPIAVLGIVVPTAWKAAAASTGGAAAIVGRLMAANTLAAAAGSLLVSFWLLRAMGLWNSFLVLSAVSCLPAFLLALRHGRLRTAFGISLATALLLVLTRAGIDRLETATIAAGEQVVARWEGAYGWVDILRDSRGLSLRENIHYRHGATGSSAMFQYRQGHVPLLLHPKPADVLFLGLGTGMTAGAASLHQEVAHVEIVELIPEVIEAARRFREFNYDILDDPDVTVRVDDARHHLVTVKRDYDVIVSDLFVPWMSKAGYLFTVEHFRAARARLKPGGIFCLWLGLYQLGATDFELISDSLASVFPETSVWWGSVSRGQARIALIGSEAPLTLDGGAIAIRIGRLRGASRLTDLYVHSTGNLYRMYIGKWPSRFERHLNTDEHPRIEFLSPLAISNTMRLAGNALSEYFNAVLARLPQSSVRFVPAPGQRIESAEERRAAARWILQRGNPVTDEDAKP